MPPRAPAPRPGDYIRGGQRRADARGGIAALLVRKIVEPAAQHADITGVKAPKAR